MLNNIVVLVLKNMLKYEKMKKLLRILLGLLMPFNCEIRLIILIDITESLLNLPI